MFLCSNITADSSYCSHEIERCLLFGRIAMTNLDSLLKSRDITLPTKIQLAKAVVFLVVKYGYESWTIKKLSTKNWCFELFLEKTLESSLDSKQIKPVNTIGNPVLNIHWKDWCWSWNSSTLATWCKNWLTGKDPEARKEWRLEDQAMAEDEMIGWYHQLDGHEFEQALGVGEGQGSLSCCNPCESQRVGHDWVTELNWMKRVESS